ncbi:MAG TPA: PIG-L deacetylase family protein [Candidatus Nanopelagicales bacterium]|nr:PIG-L deacetylase family protein [Candidatus Nanopelagicales bacterium]
MLDPADITRVLAVAAHPDDLDFGSAGTIAGLTARGVEVTYCVCTDGDAGGFDPDVPRSEIPTIRRDEQRAAAAVLGVTDVRFLGYPDGALEPTLALRRDISRVIRQVQPQLLIMQSPERTWDRIPASHPDHLAAGEATIRAVYPDARNQFAHPELAAEGLEPWSVLEVWVSGHPVADHYVDITDTFDAKVRALREHVSQTAHLSELADFLRGWATTGAAAARLPEGRLVESFFARAMPQ